MELNFVELTTEAEACEVYEIYKHCMFQTDREKFSRKIAQFLDDGSVKILACCHQNRIAGVLVISFAGRHQAEILGIAVEPSARSRGIGSYMIHQATRDYGLSSISAETDEAAVGFYRKNRFRIVRIAKSYGGERVVRYQCEWTKAITTEAIR